MDAHRNVLVVGPTGVGKTFVACALAHAALRRGHRALYLRVPRLLDELVLARADGRLPRLLAAWARIDVLVLDDLGLTPLTAAGAADLLEVIEDRVGRRSTIVTSQLPVRPLARGARRADHRRRHPRPARLGAYRIELQGDSLRRGRAEARGTDADVTSGPASASPRDTLSAGDGA